MASRGGGIGQKIRDLLGGGQGHQGQQPGQSQQSTAQSRSGGGMPSSSGQSPTVRPGAPTGTTPTGASSKGTPSSSTPYDYGDVDEQQHGTRQYGTSQQPGGYESGPSRYEQGQSRPPQGTMTPDTRTRGTTTPGTMAADTPTRGTTTPAPTTQGMQGTTTPGMESAGTSPQGQQGWSTSTTSGTGASMAPGAVTSGPGLEPLLNRFRNNGLGDHVNSWLSDGPNKTLNPQQVRQGLGDQEIADLARHAGVSQEEVADGLAKNLPQVVDRMTPHGQIPDESQIPGQIDQILGHQRR